MRRHDPEQLNTPVVSESYDLEDIIREFSSAPKEPHEEIKSAAPKKPAKDIKSSTLVFSPIRSAPKPALPVDDAPVKIAPDPKAGKFKIPAAPVVSEKTAAKTEPPAKQAAAAVAAPVKPQSPPANPAVSRKRTDFQPPLVILDKETPKKSRKQRRSAADASGHGFSCKELLIQEQQGFGLRRIRTFLLLIPALFSLLLLVCQAYGERFPIQIPEAYGDILALAAMLLSVALGYEVPVKGIRDLLRVRISMYTLSIPLCILSCIHCFMGDGGLGHCYAPCVTLLLFFQQYAISRQHIGYARSLHAVCSFSRPMGLYDAGQLLPDSDSLRKDSADIEDYTARLNQPDAPQTVLCLYSTFLLPMSCGLAFLLHYFTRCSFVDAWLLLLLCAMPQFAAASYPTAFASLAKKLSKQGGALCGWHSARTFGKRHTIILRDEDLFPAGCYTSNGMKLYGTYRAERVIAYAHAAFAAAENPLVHLFEELLRSEGATALTATTYRFYENNGMGAEILGDEVLLGTVSFMRSMGVDMPAGAKVRQAVYVAIGGELAGIFAVKYKASPSAGSGLRDILNNRNFTPVLATRDFLITPELVAQKYDMSIETLRYPEYPQRIRLSETAPGDSRVQGALIANNTFTAFAATVAASHRLKLSAYAALILSLLSGIGGLALAILLLVSGSLNLTSELYIAAYQLLWGGVTGLISLILRKL